RLTQGVVEGDVIGDMRFRFGVKNCGREKTKIAGGPRNIERACKRKWFTGVDRLCASEFLKIALDQIRNAQKNTRPVRCRGLRPHCKRLLRRGNGEIDIARIAVSDQRIGLSCSRLDVVEIFAADRVKELAVDEVLNFLSGLCHVGQSRDTLYY